MNQLSNLVHLINATGESDFATILQDEKNRIIAEWQQLLYMPDDKLKRHIRRYQYKLLRLMENIACQLPPEMFTTDQSDHHLVQLYFTLYELEVCLEENYASYLDLSCNIPLIHLLSVRQELDREIPLLRQVLSGTGMMDIILADFEGILNSDQVSFQRLYYIRELSRCLRRLQPDSNSEQVEAILLYMNFNNTIYLKYKLKLLSENIGSFPTVHQQLTQTKWLLKMNNQQQEQRNFQYSNNHPSLKQLINEWLTHERDYLEYKILYPGDTQLPEEAARWHHFKVKIDLSVNELAFLLRVMMEHGLILNSNKSEVADFFARFFATNNQSAISPDSLRTKMYSYPSSSVESVKQLLLDLFHTSKRISVE